MKYRIVTSSNTGDYILQSYNTVYNYWATERILGDRLPYEYKDRRLGEEWEE